MALSGQLHRNKIAMNQMMFKLILASLMLIVVAISLSECVKRTQYHEQVSYHLLRPTARPSQTLIKPPLQKGGG